MTMKKTELEKRKGLAIVNSQRMSGNAYHRSESAEERKQRRARERAAGLVPVALKLPQALVVRLRTMAEQRGQTIDELVQSLLDSTIQGTDSAHP